MAETAKAKATAKPAAKAKAAPKKTTTPKPKAAAKATAPKPKTAPKATAPKAVAKAKPAKGKTDDMKSKVKNDMNNFKAKATDSARAAAEKGKDRATEAVSSISKLIRDSAATIDENVGKQYGDYARSAADTVDGFASKMDAKDVDVLVGEARDFVRKSPAVAIGAAAAIGFALVRLVRSGRDDA
jgi:ElaB/YqjD/DUF883 family membrane-anchored ribosome-binding protein